MKGLSGVNEAIFDELHGLICAQAEGRLTAEEVRRLESLVLHQPAARKLYVSMVRDSAYLRWYAEAPAGGLSISSLDETEPQGPGSGSDTCTLPAGESRLEDAVILQALTDQDASDEEEVLAVAPNYARAAEPPPSPWWRIGKIAAAVLLASALMFALFRSRPAAPRQAKVIPQEPAAPVPTYATLTDAVDATWTTADGAAAPPVGSKLEAGPWVLRKGAARLVFTGGADVVVRGPARFQLLSFRAMQLTQGSVAALASHEQSGFVVYTPTATVLDLGTEFGVRVDSTRATETHVLSGVVDLTPTVSGSSVRLTESMAAMVQSDAMTTQPIEFRPSLFRRSIRSVDLVDVVAGGDGTQGRRAGGIDPRNGASVDRLPGLDERSLQGDAAFHACPANPLVAGVFIPQANGIPTQIDPAGNYLADLRVRQGQAWYWLWAGGNILLTGDPSLQKYPTTLRGVDYSAMGRGLIFMQASKGVTFDLRALRAAHPGLKLSKFKAVAGNTSDVKAADRPLSEVCDFDVLIDGKRVVSKHDIHPPDPAFDLDVDLPANASYLTLIVTDGGDGYQGDWIILGDPRLE